jgi:hypothetical protein
VFAATALARIRANTPGRHEARNENNHFPKNLLIQEFAAGAIHGTSGEMRANRRQGTG